MARKLIAIAFLIFMMGCLGDTKPKEPTPTISPLPHGGLGIAVLPKISDTNTGSTINLSIRIVSTENFDDIVIIKIVSDMSTLENRTELSWFSWTNKSVDIKTGESLLMPLEVTIPHNAKSGTKAFLAMVNSTKWTPYASDTGIINIK